MTMHTEQRAHERVSLEIEVNLLSEHNFYTGLSCDISEGGLFIATHVTPKLGEELEMRLLLPGSTTSFVVRGVVRWIRELRVASDDAPSGFGMQWTELSSEASTTIRAFVAERDTMFYEAA